MVEEEDTCMSCVVEEEDTCMSCVVEEEDTCMSCVVHEYHVMCVYIHTYMISF